MEGLTEESKRIFCGERKAVLAKHLLPGFLGAKNINNLQPAGLVLAGTVKSRVAVLPRTKLLGFARLRRIFGMAAAGRHYFTIYSRPESHHAEINISRRSISYPQNMLETLRKIFCFPVVSEYKINLNKVHIDGSMMLEFKVGDDIEAPDFDNGTFVSPTMSM